MHVDILKTMYEDDISYEEARNFFLNSSSKMNSAEFHLFELFESPVQDPLYFSTYLYDVKNL